MNLPRWRYVADGELPDGYEECLVEDAFGHRFVAEFCKKFIKCIDFIGDGVYVTLENAFISNLIGKELPNQIVRWIPMKEIIIVTEAKEEK